MKCIVTAPFEDKYDRSYEYKVGQTIDWSDQERINDCVKRGLIKIVPEEEKPKRTTRKTK